LKLKEDRKHLLIMCGSMGCGHMDRLVEEFVQDIPQGWEITVICGTNEKLYRELSSRYRKYAWIHIVGYTHQMPLFMDSADFYLTKPGGLSVTEAARKALPMGFVNAVAGCEQYNMDFFLEMGAAVTADTYEALAARCMEVMKSGSERLHMREALQKRCQKDSARSIYETMDGSRLCD